MLVEECVNDRLGNFSWGGRKIKIEGVVGEEVRFRVLLCLEFMFYKGLRLGWKN